MKLSLEQIRAVTTGAEAVEQENGRYKFYRFSPAETAVINNWNFLYTAGIRLSFETDAKSLRLKINAEDQTDGTRCYFAVDISVNGAFAGSIQNFRDEECTGNYAERLYPDGDYCGELQLGEGEKTVEITLPHSIKLEIAEAELCEATYIIPVKYGKTLLAYGDSITQGYDSLHPDNTYAMRLAKLLNAEIYNKALGGDIFCPSLVSNVGALKPDYITVAYGTNDWDSGHTSDTVYNACRDFLSITAQRFENVPVFVISPIWRKDGDCTGKACSLSEIEESIHRACKDFATVRFISGAELVPHNEALFGDLRLHPSDEGFKYYAEKLYEKIVN